MTPAEFRTARETLGLTQAKIGEQLGDGSSKYSIRTVGSWELGERKVPPAVAKLVKLMVKAKERSGSNAATA